MLRVALIGLGMAAAPHAKSLLELGDRIQVRWAASPSAARTKAFAANFPFPVTNDVAAAISDPAVDAVILLTPPDTHLELARLAFAHGKHLLVEKPLATTLAAAEALVSEAAAAGVTLGVVLQHRFRPGAVRLGELLAEGDLGAVQAASLTVPWWRPQSYYDEPGRGTRARDGGGVLMTQAIHTLDLFRHLFGPIEVQAAQARTTAAHRMETEDFVTALLRLKDGASGAMTATTAAYPGGPERIEVIAAAGCARLVGEQLTVQWLDGREETHAAPTGGGFGAGAMALRHDAHRALIADFHEAVTQGRPAGASGADALATQRLIETILNRAADDTPQDNSNMLRGNP